MTTKNAVCLILSSIVWVFIGFAILESALRDNFDPEQYCDGSKAAAIVCQQ
jgi:hypothetical protein